MEDEQRRLDRHRSFLVERVDPDFGLIDHLRSTWILTVEEANRITAAKTTEGRNRKLIDCLIKRRKTTEFISALRANGQIHLANYLNSNGVHRPEFSDDWPLSSEYINCLDVNRRYLLEHIEPTELHNDLISGKVISMWQRQFIESKPTCFDRNAALIDILRKCSIRQYKATVESLNRTNQRHVAKLLSEIQINWPTNTCTDTDIAGHVSDHVTRPVSPIGNVPSGSSKVEERTKQQQQQQQQRRLSADVSTTTTTTTATNQRCFCCLNGSVSTGTLNKQGHENHRQGQLSILISEDQVDGDSTKTAVVELGNIIEFDLTKPNPVSITWQQNFRKRTKNYLFLPFTVKGTAVSSYLAVEDGHWNAFTAMVGDCPTQSASGDWSTRSRHCALVTKDFRYGQNNEATFRFLVLGDKGDGMYQHRFAKAFENFRSQDQFQSLARTLGTVLDACLKTSFTQLAETYIGSALKEF